MKKECLSLLLAALAVNVPAATNAPSESEKKAVDLLRETIYQYEKRRGAVLPPPTLSTNAARKGTNVVNAPSRPIPWTAPPPGANVQPPARTPSVTTPPATSPPAATATTPPATSPPAASVPAGAPVHETSLAELERLYLDGKITAKQFQKYLQQHEQQQQAAAVRAPETPPATAAVRPNPPVTQTAPPKTAAPPPKRPVAAPPEAAPSPDQAAISEVEKKMDELIKAKAARDRQATNMANSATNAAAASAPKTQRQKLDDLLRMYIEGKVTEAEYKERREKILTDPK